MDGTVCKLSIVTRGHSITVFQDFSFDSQLKPYSRFKWSDLEVHLSIRRTEFQRRYKARGLSCRSSQYRLHSDAGVLSMF